MCIVQERIHHCHNSRGEVKRLEADWSCGSHSHSWHPAWIQGEVTLCTYRHRSFEKLRPCVPNTKVASKQLVYILSPCHVVTALQACLQSTTKIHLHKMISLSNLCLRKKTNKRSTPLTTARSTSWQHQPQPSLASSSKPTLVFSTELLQHCSSRSLTPT